MKGFFVSLGALFEKNGAAQTGILFNSMQSLQPFKTSIISFEKSEY